MQSGQVAIRLFLGLMVIMATTSVCAEQPQPSTLSSLRYITEHSPPYNYLEDGVLKGPAVDLLLAATARAGSPITRGSILVQPWARAYRNALEGPNTVLFNTIRTEERETLFKWAGPTGTEKYVLVARRAQSIQITKPADIFQYRVGAVREDVGEAYLRELGVPARAITLTSSVDNLGKMLKANRIDLWAFGEDGWRQSLTDSGIDVDDYEAVYLLKKNDYFFAFSLDVDDALVKRMQWAIDAILLERAEGMATEGMATEGMGTP